MMLCTHISLSLCLCNVQLKSNTSPLHYSRRSPYNSPPPTTLSLPPISRIQHQHTMNVGVEKDREGENLPKIILTHNRVVKRDRNRGLGWICVYQNKIVQGGQTREFPCPSAWFSQTNQETGKALGRFCFRRLLHSWLLLVSERGKSRKEAVGGYVIQTSGRGSVKKIATPSHTVVILSPSPPSYLPWSVYVRMRGD